MGKLEIVLVVIGALAGAVWYWWRVRKDKSEQDGTMSTKGGGGRGGLKR